jgi:hypothetical protein
MFKGLCFAAAIAVLGWCVVDAATTEETRTVSGTVTASCALLAERPTPEVSAVDGEQLGGRPSITTPVGSLSGACTADYRVADLPVRSAYVVRIESMSATFSSADALGNATLSAA